jgi:hypothetical protein
MGIGAGRAINVPRAGLSRRTERRAIGTIFVIGLDLGRRIDDVSHFPHIRRATAAARAIRVLSAWGPVGTEADGPAFTSRCLARSIRAGLAIGVLGADLRIERRAVGTI